MGIQFLAALLALTLALLAGCAATSNVDTRNLSCPTDTNQGACETIANMAIRLLNRAAIGPIDSVTVESVDCARLAAAMFRSELTAAAGCWTVAIEGDDSRGNAVVWQNQAGILEADLGS